VRPSVLPQPKAFLHPPQIITIPGTGKKKKPHQRESQAAKATNSFSFSASFSRHRPPSFAPKTEEQLDCIKHSKRRRQATKTPCSWLFVELRNQRFRYG